MEKSGVESCRIAEICTAEEQQQREETQVPQNGGKKEESPRSWIADWRRIATIEESIAIMMQLSSYSKLRGFVRRIHKRIRSGICASIDRICQRSCPEVCQRNCQPSLPILRLDLEDPFKELHLGYLLSRDLFEDLAHFGNFNGYRYRELPFFGWPTADFQKNTWRIC